jgi:ClpP class serine protease
MWFLKHEVAADMRRALDAGLAPDAAQCAAFIDRIAAELTSAGALSLPRNMSVSGNVAQINIEGVLTTKPDLFSILFGGGNTTYESIQSGLAMAAADPAVKSLVLNVNSPGGQVNGLFDTLAAIEEFKATGKPISVRASMADSAAYAIAAVAGPIVATNAAAEFGSIGVAASFLKDEEIIDIASTEAPDKRPDVSTEEGQAVVRKYLDAVHELFVDAIARGRGTTVEDVNTNYGRGSVLLAGEAKKRGMINKSPPALRIAYTAEAGSIEIEAAAVPHTKYPLKDAGSWDGAAATGRVRKWASSNGSGDADTMDWAKYRKAFTWYDAENGESFGAYKLPHHDVVNGGLVTVRAGVIAAGNAVAGSRGGVNIPASDLPAVKSHLAAHYKEFDMTAPWESEAINESAASGGADRGVAPLLQSTGKRKMTLEVLKAEHPELYAAIFAEGKEAGIVAERKRVQAHLKLATATGATAVAHAAIASGASVMDEEVHAEYLAAGMNRAAVGTRQAESDAAGAAVSAVAAAAPAVALDLGDQVVAALKAQTI